MAYTTIDKPSDYFNTVTYTGNSTTTNAITGVNFQPDWVWLKGRNIAESHRIYDAVRGASNHISSNGTGAEASIFPLTSFDSDGFTIGSADGSVNGAYNYTSWNWLADNTSGSSNTDGSITSTVSENTTSGFSIVTWTGTGSTGTIGHGLSSTPKMILVKNRTASGNGWGIYHTSIGATKYIQFTASPAGTGSTPWNDTEPTSSVFTVGTWVTSNQSGASMVAYCFNDVKGYSKFGSYVGNGNSDGTFIYTGFRPAFLLYKCSSTDFTNWQVFDNKRSTYNLSVNRLNPNDSSVELATTADSFDLLSNGFKARNTGSNSNNSGDTYIYMAFAEHPLVSSTGTPCTAR
jgi:hypothetical protein